MNNVSSPNRRASCPLSFSARAPARAARAPPEEDERDEEQHRGRDAGRLSPRQALRPAGAAKDVERAAGRFSDPPQQLDLIALAEREDEAVVEEPQPVRHLAQALRDGHALEPRLTADGRRIERDPALP